MYTLNVNGMSEYVGSLFISIYILRFLSKEKPKLLDTVTTCVSKSITIPAPPPIVSSTSVPQKSTISGNNSECSKSVEFSTSKLPIGKLS